MALINYTDDQIRVTKDYGEARCENCLDKLLPIGSSRVCPACGMAYEPGDTPFLLLKEDKENK